MCNVNDIDKAENLYEGIKCKKKFQLKLRFFNFSFNLWRRKILRKFN